MKKRETKESNGKIIALCVPRQASTKELCLIQLLINFFFTPPIPPSHPLSHSLTLSRLNNLILYLFSFRIHAIPFPSCYSCRSMPRHILFLFISTAFAEYETKKKGMYAEVNFFLLLILVPFPLIS